MKTRGLSPRLTIMSLILGLIIMLSMAACSQKTEPAATTAAPTPQTFNLKFVDMYTPGAKDAMTGDDLINLITKNTNNKVQITVYHGTLGKATEFLTMLDGGACDIANLTPGNYPNQFPLEAGAELPVLGFTSRTQRIDAMWELFNKGYFTSLAKYKVLAFNPTPGMNFYFAKPVKTVADMKGLRLRASDPNMLNLIGKIGGVPTPIASPDVYMSLQKGVIDGAYTAYEQVLQSKWYEVTKYTLWNPLSQGCMYIVMKKSVWDSMPPDVQLGINQAINDYKYAYLARVQDADRTAVPELEKNGVNVSYLSAADLAILKDAAATISKDWVTAQGQKGQDLMNELAKIVARYQ